MPELLSPAGNFEKLKAAILYGADAVYLAGNEFGMRAASDNFSIDQLYEAVKYAHERHVKVYLTINTMPRIDEYSKLEIYLDNLVASGIDAVIVADIGVLELVKERLPQTNIHVSTQANIVSHASCNAWHRLGATRVVLARELSLNEIKNINKNISKELELEVFIHGSMCISYSGRCLLSNHFTGRDANRGMCAQPCRWDYNISKYEIAEEKRPNMKFPIEQNDNGTFVFSSKDMCMIEHIPELMESGIESFKIEGRMKSSYYTAVITNAYRMAINLYEKNPSTYMYDDTLLREVESVSHREYCTGYFFDNAMENAQTCEQPGYMREKAYLSYAVSYDKTSELAEFVQRNKLISGTTVELISPGSIGKSFTVDEIYDMNGNKIESTPHPFMHFKIKVPFEVYEGDILRS